MTYSKCVVKILYDSDFGKYRYITVTRENKKDRGTASVLHCYMVTSTKKNTWILSDLKIIDLLMIMASNIQSLKNNDKSDIELIADLPSAEEIDKMLSQYDIESMDMML